MKRRVRVWLSGFLLLTLLLSATHAFAAGAPKGKAYGTADPYQLSMQALLGKDGTTDLSLSAIPAPGYAAPDALKKVQLKSFTLDGRLTYTKNFTDVPAPDGKAALTLTGATRGQPLKAMVGVQNAQTVSETILTGETRVLLRPDLTVNRVEAAPQATVNVPVPVNVVLQELNGDLGATARVEIVREGAALDVVESARVDAGATSALGFLLTFAEPGTYTLAVQITDVEPGDYDLTNNTATFTVDVWAPPSAEYYFTSYYWYADDDQNDWYVYRIGETEPFMHTHKQTREDMFSLVLMADGDPQVHFADEVTLTLTSETGASRVMTVGGITGPGTYSADGSSLNSVRVFHFPTYSALYVSSYAGTWTMSQNFLDSSSAPYERTESAGQIVGAMERMNVKLDLTDSRGTRSNGYTLDLSEQFYTHDSWYDNTYDNTRTHYTIYRHFYAGTLNGYLAY